jgi:hypothetical protein
MGIVNQSGNLPRKRRMDINPPTGIERFSRIADLARLSGCSDLAARFQEKSLIGAGPH